MRGSLSKVLRASTFVLIASSFVVPSIAEAATTAPRILQDVFDELVADNPTDLILVQDKKKKKKKYKKAKRHKKHKKWKKKRKDRSRRVIIDRRYRDDDDDDAGKFIAGVVIGGAAAAIIGSAMDNAEGAGTAQ